MVLRSSVIRQDACHLLATGNVTEKRLAYTNLVTIQSTRRRRVASALIVAVVYSYRPSHGKAMAAASLGGAQHALHLDQDRILRRWLNPPPAQPTCDHPTSGPRELVLDLVAALSALRAH